MTADDRLPPAAGTLAGLVLAVTGGLALFVCLRFVFDDLTGRRHFATGADIAVYYVIPAAVGVLCLAALRLPAIGRLRVLMAAGGVVAALYFSEATLVVSRGSPEDRTLLHEGDVVPAMTALLRSRHRDREATALEQRVGRPIDSRTPAEIIDAFERRGTPLERIITASNQLFLMRPDGRVDSATAIDGREVVPLGGVSHQRTLMCNESGDWVDFTSDRHGFANPDAVWDLAQLDVAAVGDSFAQGYCVPQGKGFMDLVRARRPATLNLGISGDGPLLELATLLEFLPAFAPRTVLWCYFEGNDLTDLQIERKNAVLMRYLDGSFTQPDLRRQPEIDRQMRAQVPRLLALEAENLRDKRWESVRSRAVSVLKLTALRNRLSPVQQTNGEVQRAAEDLATKNVDVFRAVLTGARDRVAAWDGQLYFVYLPEWSRFAGYHTWGIRQRQTVIAVARQLGIPIIDLLPPFEATGDPAALFPFREIGHYTEAGHRLVADTILGRLSAAASR